MFIIWCFLGAGELHRNGLIYGFPKDLNGRKASLGQVSPQLAGVMTDEEWQRQFGEEVSREGQLDRNAGTFALYVRFLQTKRLELVALTPHQLRMWVEN